jgi:hypothetical protein
MITTSTRPTAGSASSAPGPSMIHDLISLLGIPAHLTDRKETGLRLSYQKYKAFLAAKQEYDKKHTAGT